MDKHRVYDELLRELDSVLEGEPDLLVRMATVCAILKRDIPWVSWVGFYRVTAPGVLAVGPYQGDIGCLRITFDRGVCGAAARTRSTQVVPDVHAFPGHIACDVDARSEIVLPVLAASGEVTAVLDLDSHLPAAFDQTDRTYLEELVGRFFPPASGERAPG
jgi:L-methionine (R)-S-oxide reductase